MRKYIIQLEINEGYDEFWEDATKNNKTGCDEVLELIKETLFDVGFDDENCKINVVRYENDSE